jgi:flagellar basal-body rod modification protein FlgD
MTSVSTTTPTATGATIPNTPGAITNQSQFSTAYSQFLSMLTTELKNQDPTSPMDTTQFTNQLVGFSQLEQQLQTNTKLDTLAGGQKTNALSNALGYLGHSITATGDGLTLDGTNPGEVTYSLPSSTASATLTVTDSSGTTVRTETVPTGAGLHSLSYDGSDNGQERLPAGNYTFAIAATDGAGQPVTATTYFTGKVTGIDTSSGSPMLEVGTQKVDISTVTGLAS